MIEGDEVEMFGPNIPVAEIAEKAGTIVWEIFTGITPRVMRCYHGIGTEAGCGPVPA